MNNIQKQLIVIEVIVISLFLWRYHTDQLTILNAMIYSCVYIVCMAGWFYFKDK